ncbi:MAG: hypothetical protein ACJAQ3_004206, partial [Planctomycetota bacterium]
MQTLLASIDRSMGGSTQPLLDVAADLGQESGASAG